MQTIQMLRQLTQVDGVAGGEDHALAVAQEICENLGECSRTIQKSLICQVMPPQEGRPHLLLDAHIDEIGLTVTHIEDNGFLRVGQAGGVDRRLLMASQVVVHTAQGDLPGVVGSVPPHIQSGEKKNPTVDEIWIDVGMDGQQAKEKIDLGSKISFVGPFTEMAGVLVSSKAFDDRCCCVAIIKAAELIKNDWKENHLEPFCSVRRKKPAVWAPEPQPSPCTRPRQSWWMSPLAPHRRLQTSTFHRLARVLPLEWAPSSAAKCPRS